MRIFLQILAACFFEFTKGRRTCPAVRCVIEKDHLPKVLDRLNAFLGMLPELFTGNEEHLRTGILENITYLIDRLRRVDRHVDRAKAQDRKVNKRPFRPILRDYSDTVARADTPSFKPCRITTDTIDHFAAF